MTRGHLLQAGVGGALVLALPRCNARPAVPAPGYAFLATSDRAFAGAAARAILGPALRDEAELDAAVRGFDTAIVGLPPAVRGEIRQLLDLVTSPLTRGATTGVWHGWERASDDEVAAFLARWRESSFALFRSGYGALHALVSGGWYGSPRSWAAIGYPGPPVLRS